MQPAVRATAESAAEPLSLQYVQEVLALRETRLEAAAAAKRDLEERKRLINVEVSPTSSCVQNKKMLG